MTYFEAIERLEKKEAYYLLLAEECKDSMKDFLKAKRCESIAYHLSLVTYLFRTIDHGLPQQVITESSYEILETEAIHRGHKNK